MEEEKLKITHSSNDWLLTQSREIQINYQINQIKIEQNKADEYERKIENIINKEQIKKSKQWPKNSTLNNLIEEKTEDKLDDDDILLEEAENDETDSDDEENTSYKPTKVYDFTLKHKLCTYLLKFL